MDWSKLPRVGPGDFDPSDIAAWIRPAGTIHDASVLGGEPHFTSAQAVTGIDKGYDAVMELMRAGTMRVTSGEGTIGISIIAAPTQPQVQIVKRLIREYGLHDVVWERHDRRNANGKRYGPVESGRDVESLERLVTRPNPPRGGSKKTPYPVMVENAALAFFGETDEPREAGYILSDGRMLDFSGKNEGGSPGQRALDHREIGRASNDKVDLPGGTEGMLWFMQTTGALRCSFFSDNINIDAEGVTPTGAQIRTVIRAWNELGRPSAFYVDRGGGGSGDVSASGGTDIFSPQQIRDALETSANPSAPRRARAAIYDACVAATGSGPLDGACYAYARAFAGAHGGQLYSIEGRRRGGRLQAHHVVVRVGAKLYDAEGAHSEATLLRRWRNLEQVEGARLRPFRSGDVPDSPRDANLVAKLKEILTMTTRDNPSALRGGGRPTEHWTTKGVGGVSPKGLEDALRRVLWDQTAPDLARVDAMALLNGDAEDAAKRAGHKPTEIAMIVLSRIVSTLVNAKPTPKSAPQINVLRTWVARPNPPRALPASLKRVLGGPKTPQLELFRVTRGKTTPLMGPQTVAYEFAALALLNFEEFWVVPVNNRHAMVGRYLISRGGPSSSPVYVSEVMRVVLFSGCAAFLVVHCHPSGNMTPSSDDLAITQVMKDAARVVQLKMLDHIIVGASTSMMGRKWTPDWPAREVKVAEIEEQGGFAGGVKELPAEDFYYDYYSFSDHALM